MIRATSPADTPGTPAAAPPCPASAPEPISPPSLIETMRAEPGAVVPLLEGHLARLQRSSKTLGNPWPGEQAVRDKLAQALKPLALEQSWRLRLLLDNVGTLSLETAPLPTLSLPLKVAVSGPRASGAERWLQHKTTHRPWYVEATQWLANHPEIFDVLYWNEDGLMSEGSRSNVYIQTETGRWLTPPTESGALPGVQRQALLDSGQVDVAVIHRDDFLQARQVRISNALRGWCDAIIVNG